MALSFVTVILLSKLLGCVYLCQCQQIAIDDILNRLEALEVQGLQQKNLIGELESKIFAQQEQLVAKDGQIQRLEVQINKQQQQLQHSADKMEALERKVASLVDDRMESSDENVKTMAADMIGHQLLHATHYQGGKTEALESTVVSTEKSRANMLGGNEEHVQAMRNTKSHHAGNKKESFERNVDPTKVSNEKRQALNLAEPIAFSAYLSQSKKLHMGANQNINFDSSPLNFQNAYHTQQGVFIAPCSGIYLFSSRIQLDVDSRADDLFTIVQNNRALAACRSYMILTQARTYVTSCSMTIVTQMQAGDEVWVKTSFAAQDIGIYGKTESHFTGVMLFAF